MSDDTNLEVVMSLIMYGGDARSSAFEAIQLAKKGDFEAAQNKLKAAKQALTQAHHSQTQMLTKEANGDKTPINLLMVHAQDHLMTGMTFVDMATELVQIYEKYGI